MMALLPQQDTLFSSEAFLAVTVFNSFGASIGLVQIVELGQIETSILFTNIWTCTLLIHSLESRQVYPLLGLEPPTMVDTQILAYFSAASWHGVAKSVVRDRLTQQEQKE